MLPVVVTRSSDDGVAISYVCYVMHSDGAGETASQPDVQLGLAFAPG